MGNLLLRLLVLLFCFVQSVKLSANSCCGQSPASFTVLNLEQRLSLNLGFAYLRSMGRALHSDEFLIWDGKTREIRSLNLNLASTLASRHQVFLNSSLMQGYYAESNMTQTSNHLSDTLIGYNFELLPEYSYSRWRPLIYVSALINLPSGQSSFEPIRLGEGGDVTGHNQWGGGVGLTLRKVYFPLTMTFQARTLYLFAKSFPSVQVSGFYDSSLALLANYDTSIWNLTLNTGLTLTHLSQRRVEPAGETSDVGQNTTVLLGFQRPLTEQWVVGLNYSDQTLLGPARGGLVLNRGINLNFNYNYD
jgi:hypothetical protein